MLYDWSMDSNYSTSLGSRIVVCAGAGGANTTPYFLAAHFAKRNTKFGGGKRGRAKIHPPHPPFFLPARAHGIVCAARSAASCRFSEIFDKMSSSQTVKTHQIRSKEYIGALSSFGRALPWHGRGDR